MAVAKHQEVNQAETTVPVKRWRHRHRVLSCLAILAVPVLLILTGVNWRYRFEFQEGNGIELPPSKKNLNGWIIEEPSRVTITRENKDRVLELRSTGDGKPVSVVYRLPDIPGVDFIRVQAEMRCLGEHDDAAWKRARINLVGYDASDKPLYKYPHQLGYIKDLDTWQIEDSVFRLPSEARSFEVQIYNQKTTLLQVKRLKVLAARERGGFWSYRLVSFLLGVCWVIAVSLVARAYGGARKWWRAVSVAIVLIASFLTVVYPAIKRPVRPPLSKRFHDWVSFELEESAKTSPELKKEKKEEHQIPPEVEQVKRTGPSFAWLRENTQGLHILLYGTLALAVCSLAWSARAAWLAGAVALLQEGRQSWIDNNTDMGDLVDLGMDLIGILLGILIYLAFRYHVLKRLLRKAKNLWKDQI